MLRLVCVWSMVWGCCCVLSSQVFCSRSHRTYVHPFFSTQPRGTWYVVCVQRSHDPEDVLKESLQDKVVLLLLTAARYIIPVSALSLVSDMCVCVIACVRAWVRLACRDGISWPLKERVACVEILTRVFFFNGVCFF